MWWRKKRSFEDFKAEIEAHLGLEGDEIRDAGLSADCDGAARRAFGNVTAAQERWYEHRHWMVFDNLRLDVRQGIRQLRMRPGFCAFAILTLALGIGTNSAIFAIVDAVLLRPLPYKDPGRLAMVFSGDPARELHEGRVSLLNFTDWRTRSRSFEDMTVFIGQTFLLRGGERPERLRSARVEANFWPLLGVQPILGRVFGPEEEKRGERLAVLSYQLWHQEFGGSRAALGAHLTMDDRSYEVIGVMPPDFHFPFPDTMVWEPVTAHPYWVTRDQRANRSESVWLVLGRLRAGATWARAQQEMDGVAQRLRLQFPRQDMPASIPMVPLDVHFTAKFRRSLWLLQGSVALMLLIACINVAGLLLARQSAREREFAVRRALGAGRLRVAGQVLTEVLVLATCGAFLGLLLASCGTAAIRASGPADIPRLQQARIDWPVILFTAGIAILAALLASLWPVFEANRTRISSRDWTSISTRRAGNLLVIGQFALALMLMISATLLIHSFLRLRAVEPGFRPDHLLSMRVDLHVGKTLDQQAAYFEDAIQRAEAIPGVHSAAAASGFLRSDPEDSVQIEGRAPQHPGPCRDLIAGRFFETAGIPLRSGRVFSVRDRRGAVPVAIINETMARAYWPGADPLGQRFRFGNSMPWVTVVGVTGDMRRQGLDQQIAPQAFLPHRQGQDNMMDLIVRTELNPVAMASMVQKQIQDLDKTVAKFKVETVTQELEEQTGERRFDAFLAGSFAAAALFLSAIGIYGLLHHLVVQRTNEIGVRMALGARSGTVMAMVLRQGLILAFAGTALGLAGALLISRLLSKLLYEVSTTDPLAVGVSILLLVIVAMAACWVPARRAAGIDPMLALRHD